MLTPPATQPITDANSDQPTPAPAAGALHIVLVRHGQTDANERGIAQGHQPTSLNALGHEQARLVAQRLATFRPRIELLISSDLPRAAETAAPLARLLGLEVRYDAAWRERPLGIMEGKNRQQREALRQEHGLGPHDLQPGAQSVADYQAGIGAALSRLIESHQTARCIAIVTHAGACRAVAMMLADGRLPAALGNPAPASFDCPNAAITHLIHRVTRDGPQFSCACVYNVAHLQTSLITTRDDG